MSNIVDIKKLSFSYGKKIIFEDFSLSIPIGSFTTVIDSDNNGKTTLAQIISGKLKSNANIRVCGKILNEKNIVSIRKKIFVLGENIDGMFILSDVMENLYFILENRGLSKKEIEDSIKNFLRMVGYEYILEKKVNDLSDGEKQIIALFSGLSLNPQLLIIDNGMTMIDGTTKQKIFLLLNSLNKKGMSIINFTSDIEDLLRSSHVVLINKGKLLMSTELENAFNDIKIYEENNIPLPFVVDLSIKLKYYGKIDKIYFNEKKLVDALWK